MPRTLLNISLTPPFGLRIKKKSMTLLSKSSAVTVGVMLVGSVPALSLELTLLTARIAASLTMNSRSAPHSPLVTAATADKSTDAPIPRLKMINRLRHIKKSALCAQTSRIEVLPSWSFVVDPFALGKPWQLLCVHSQNTLSSMYIWQIHFDNTIKSSRSD